METACGKGHPGVVRALANAEARVNVPVSSTVGEPGNNSLLAMAIGFGHVEVVEALLQAGANPTAVYGNGPTPIAVACAAGDIPGPARAAIVHLLLQAGADPRVAYGPQPGEPSRARSGGAGGCRGGSRGGPRAMDLAAETGAAEVIPVLVAAGEDPGRAPADVSYEEVEAGARPPPLIMAAVRGHVGVIQALVAAGADVEATVGADGSSGRGGGGGGIIALCVAVQQGHAGVVRVLAAAGADTRMLCDDGRTLVQVARDKGMAEVVELLAAEAEWN